MKIVVHVPYYIGLCMSSKLEFSLGIKLKKIESSIIQKNEQDKLTNCLQKMYGFISLFCMYLAYKITNKIKYMKF